MIRKETPPFEYQVIDCVLGVGIVVENSSTRTE